MSDYRILGVDDFPKAFEGSFARLQVCVEEAYLASREWPEKVAAAIQAALEFAAENPDAVHVLLNESLAHGEDGISRYDRLLEPAMEVLALGRDELPSRRSPLPALTERAIAGGILMLVAQHLDLGCVEDLPALAPEVIQFALTPYLGIARARGVALFASRV
jgi:hypothetical protein